MNEPRRVLLLSGSLYRAGAETQLVMLARRLRRSGWDVSVVAMLPINDFSAELEGLDVHTLGMGRRSVGPGSVRRFFALVKARRPDALVSFTYPANLFGRVMGRLAGVPVIVTSIRSERLGGALKELALRLTLPLDTFTTTNAELVGRSLARRGLADARRLRVIPNGVELERFAPGDGQAAAVRRELGVEAGAFVWMAVGRLEPPKDYASLLHAFRDAATERPAHLVILGEGSLRAALEALASELGIAARVTLPGSRTDVPRLLSGADAVVLSSIREGLPNALLEALAAGRPAVATTVGGVREIVSDGESGYLVPPGDPAALAAAMARMMALPVEARERMGLAGRRHIEADLSADAMADRWRGLLESAIVARPRARRGAARRHPAARG